MSTLTKEQSAARGLIPDIKAHWREHVKSGRDFMKNAIEIGKLLIKMKELLPHGEFTPIVEEQFEFGIKQAQNYMRISGYVPKLPADVDPEEMSIKGLLRLASEAKPKSEPGSHLQSASDDEETTCENDEPEISAPSTQSEAPDSRTETNEEGELLNEHVANFVEEAEKLPTFSERVKAHNLEIDRMANRIRDALEPIPTGHELEKKLTVIKQQVQSVCGTIRTCKVHDKPCPKCEDNGKACKVCGGTGMVTEMTYDGMGGK